MKKKEIRMQSKRKNKFTGRRTLLLVLNLMLIFSLGLLGLYFNLIPTEWLPGDIAQLSEDESKEMISSVDKEKNRIFLVEQEQIEKQKQKLELRENILNQREQKLKELETKYQTILKQLRIKEEQFAERETKLKNRERNWSNREKNINDLAQKITNMPPDKSSTLLNEIDSLLVVDIFAKMDEQARLKGENSMVPYLMSLMNLEKVQEVVELKAKFPDELMKSLTYENGQER